MDWRDVSTEKIADKFFVEGKKIENISNYYTYGDYISNQKDVPADCLNSFDQSKHDDYNQRKKEKAQDGNDVSQKNKDRKIKEIWAWNIKSNFKDKLVR